MGINQRAREQLRQRLESNLHWIEKYRHTAAKGRDVRFFQTLREYVMHTLRSLDRAKNNREFAKVYERARKADEAAISYVHGMYGDDIMFL